MIWILVALFAGGVLGFFTAALLCAAKTEPPSPLIGDRLDCYGPKQ